MSERRFVLQEIVIQGAQYYIVPSGDFVTESELKRRLIYISQYVPGVDRAIDILLHGEGEKHLDGKTYVTDDQPTPTPTRAEWEAWAKRFATSIKERHFFTVDDIADNILEMPIVPKE